MLAPVPLSERGLDRRTFLKGLVGAGLGLADATVPRTVDAASIPTLHFQEAYFDHPNIWFLAKTYKGEPWTRYLEWKLVRKQSLHYWDAGNVGEMFAQTEDDINSFRFFMRTNPEFVDDIQQGDENRPGLWIRSMPNTRIQLLDSDGNHIFRDGEMVEIMAEDKGNSGVILPRFRASFGLRLEFDRPIHQRDHRFRVGPQHPEDRGDLPVLNVRRFLS